MHRHSEWCRSEQTSLSHNADVVVVVGNLFVFFSLSRERARYANTWASSFVWHTRNKTLFWMRSKHALLMKFNYEVAEEAASASFSLRADTDVARKKKNVSVKMLLCFGRLIMFRNIQWNCFFIKTFAYLRVWQCADRLSNAKLNELFMSASDLSCTFWVLCSGVEYWKCQPSVMRWRNQYSSTRVISPTRTFFFYKSHTQKCCQYDSLLRYLKVARALFARILSKLFFFRFVWPLQLWFFLSFHSKTNVAD